jgi:hypothetical protein
MSFEKDVKKILGEAAVNYKKLDQLVRQGMLSPAALPILHRGLDKMQAGQVLNPQEREAVNKVMQSMLYIVTGDDTVFQKAKQHTQKNRYQSEDTVEEGETEQLDEYGNYSVGIKGQGGTTVKARSDKEASQKAFKNMGIADRHRKTMPHTVKKVGEDTVSEESPAEDKLSSSYKAKFAAMLKKTGKSLKDMSDDEKKAFFTKVDGAHDAKDESVEEGAMSRIDYQQKSGEKGTGLKTFKKKPAPKNTMVASPKTQRVKMTTAKAAERMVKKGAVYAEDAVTDSEEMRAKAARKAARTATKVAGREKATDPGIKEDAASDARRAMRSDSKGMAPLKKDKKTTYSGAKAGEERHGGHIVMQLRKAVSINKPVKFKDGSEHKVSKADAHKFLSKYNSQKPADREKMHSGHDSHDSFQSHINNK